MTRSVADIAEEMRAVATDRAKSRDLLVSLFADTVELRHVPPSPSDGPIPGRVLSDVSGREVAALARALPDAEHGGAEVTVEGDAVRVRVRTSGVLADGTRIDVETNTRFTIADGAIVALQSDMDAGSAEAWKKVLAAGSFEAPAERLTG